MFIYPVTLTPDKADGGFVVTFDDIPEAISQGDTLAQALAAAKDALESALDFYFEDKRVVPAPSKAKRGQNVIELSASLSAKVLLLNEMVTQNVRHTTRIDGIAAALQALGKHLDMRVV